MAVIRLSKAKTTKVTEAQKNFGSADVVTDLSSAGEAG